MQKVHVQKVQQLQYSLLCEVHYGSIISIDFHYNVFLLSNTHSTHEHSADGILIHAKDVN